jgi:hypothetical protein
MKQYRILIKLTSGSEEEFSICGSEEKLRNFLSEYKQRKSVKSWELLEESSIAVKQFLFG